MREQIKARPTEYKGTVYRSKSEAYVARWLDSLDWAFSYEPEWLRVGNYVPDFAYSTPRNYFLTGMWHPSVTVVEFKPVAPTRTYMLELEARFREIENKVKDSFEIGFELWLGSPFKIESMEWCVLSSSSKKWKGYNLWPFMDNHDPRDLKSYRFDLKT